MKQTQAYFASNPFDGAEVYLSKGKARDASQKFKPVTIHHEKDLSTIRYNDRHVWNVTRADYEPDVSDHFYLSREEAIAAALKAGVSEFHAYLDVREYPLDIEHFEPIQFPHYVELRRNERGLFCRLHTNPDEDGYGTGGKIHFPDRSCAKHLCEGPATIECITSDKGSYGFFKAKMVQYTAPSEKQVAKFVAERGLQNSKVRFMESKFFGSYVHIPDLDYCECLVVGMTGDTEINFSMTEYGEAVSTCVRECLGKDLIAATAH